MEAIDAIRAAVISRRKELALRQKDLAEMSQVSLPTIKALEQGKKVDLGFSKVVRILTALGLELNLRPAGNVRPTLEDLQRETGDD